MPSDDKLSARARNGMSLRTESASKRLRGSWRAAPVHPIAPQPNFNCEPTTPPREMQCKQNSI